MILSGWVDGKWCYRHGLTVCGVIGVDGRYAVPARVDGKCMVLSAWVDSAWNYRRGWTVSGTCIMISVTASINGLLVQEDIMISRSALI